MNKYECTIIVFPTYFLIYKLNNLNYEKTEIKKNFVDK